MVILAAWCSNATAEAKLQWRRGRTPAHTASDTARHQDLAVRQAAYEGGPTGQATLRSIVVDRSDPPEGIRSAQLPIGEGNSRYEEQLRAPFGNLPAPGNADLDGQLEELEPMQMPEEEMPGLERTQRSPAQESPEATPEPALPRRTTVDPFEEEPETSYALGARSMEEEREKAREFCSQELAGLKASTLHDVDVSIAVSGQQGADIPYECSIDDGTLHPGRCWPQTTYMWKSSALCHKPLYFEDEALERYGHSWGPYVQPLVSGAHFFSRLPVLPYCMGLEAPNECIYALGHYRPGSCAPYLIDPVPFTWRAALFEAGAVVGAAAVLP